MSKVLIGETCGIRIHKNYGRFSEERPGFSIQLPGAGIVSQELWEQIDIFQNLKIETTPEMDSIIENEGGITDQAIFEGTDIQKWNDLMKENSAFSSTVAEFIALIASDPNGKETYTRHAVLLGKPSWEKVRDIK